jgi:hypothetical protein
MDIDWRPGIGDPTFGGWFTVFLYVLAVLSCLRTTIAIRDARPPEPDSVVFWRNVTALMAALGVNKQLDLQTAFTELGRAIARAHGWYEQRVEVQIAFILLVGCCALATVVLMTARLRRAPASTAVASFGVTFVLAFVFIRAASFHHFDRFIGTSILGFRWNWVLEMGGISLVIAGGRSRYATLRRAQSHARTHIQPRDASAEGERLISPGSREAR